MDRIKLHALNIFFIIIIFHYSRAMAFDDDQLGKRVEHLTPLEVSGRAGEYASSEGSTANRSETPLIQSPQSVQVITNSVIREQNNSQLSDALKNISGVHFDFGFNGSAQPLVILRGFSSSSQSGSSSMAGSSTYYLDGTKVRGAPVNMFNVDSVEVVKGPSTVLYGRSEPGGLINIVSKPISNKKQINLQQTIGQYDLSATGIEATGALNRSKSLSGRVAVSNSQTKSIREFVEDKMKSFSTGVSWKPDGRTILTPNVDYTDQRYRTDYGVPAQGNRPADLSWKRQFNNSPDLSKAQTTVLKLDFVRELTDDWFVKGKILNLHSKTSEVDIATYRENLGSPAPDQQCPGTGNPICRYYFGATPDGRTHVDQYNLDIIGKITQRNVGHTLVLGFEEYHSNRTGMSYRQQVSSVDIYNPNLGARPRLDRSQALVSDNQDKSDWTSFYVQDQLSLPNGFFLTGALRNDKTSAAFGRTDVKDNNQSFTTPRVQLLWNFVENQSLYIQYQNAVSANNGRDVLTGKSLEAEKGEAWEAGYKIKSNDKKVSSTLAIYQLTKTNRGSIVRIAQPPFFTISPVGEARSRGIEWDISGDITKKNSLIASYAYTDAIVTKDDEFKNKRVPNVARNVASFWTRYSFDDRWNSGLGLYAMGERQGDQANTFQMPGYARLDFMAGHNFMLWNSKSILQLNVDNILNKKYYEGSHQFVSDWIKVGAPMLAKLSLRIEI